jgi:hypothetical protein
MNFRQLTRLLHLKNRYSKASTAPRTKAKIVMQRQPNRTRNEIKAGQQPFVKLDLLSQVEHMARNNGVMSSRNF